jgi:hypothetical protein
VLKRLGRQIPPLSPLLGIPSCARLVTPDKDTSKYTREMGQTASALSRNSSEQNCPPLSLIFLFKLLLFIKTEKY